jgi:multiple sugar transport system substrate-binding protein
MSRYVRHIPVKRNIFPPSTGPVFMVLLVLGVVLTSCGPDEAETPPAGADRPFIGTDIHVLANDHPWVHHIARNLSAFTRATGATVTFEVYPEEQFRAKRTVEMLSGISDIDVFMIMPGNSLDEYRRRGWVEPLDGYFPTPSAGNLDESLLEDGDFYPEALAAGMRDGRHYSIPLLLETSILAYNREIFRDYGLSVPETMDELERTAADVFDRSGGTIYGITMRGRGASATSQWADFLHSFGGSWFDSDGLAALHSPQSLRALEFYGRLLREYGPRDATSNGWYESLSIFMRGEAAMIFDANVFRTHYEDPDQSNVAGQVGYAQLPRGPAGSVPHISHWGLAMYPGSEKKDAAWQFMVWAAAREQALSAHLAGIPSARMSVWTDPQVTSVDPAPEWTAASTGSYEIATYQWNPPVYRVDEARSVVGEAIVDAIIGQNPEEAARRASRELDRIARED